MSTSRVAPRLCNPFRLRKARWVTSNANGGSFRLSYSDGMVQPFEVYTFNAVYSFTLKGELGDTTSVLPLLHCTRSPSMRIAKQLKRALCW